MMRGSRVQVRVPQRGDKRELHETVTRNAKEEFTRHRLRRASDHNSRARALNELQDALGLPEAPLRIECYDMAHFQGTDYVGSMVVLEDGLPRKSEYRRFKVKGVAGNDDFAAMEEVLTRRLTAYLAERDAPVGDRPGQVRLPAAAAARRRGQGPAGRGRAKVLEELGLDDEIPVAVAGQAFRGGLRARAGSEPVAIARHSPRRCTCCSGSATRPTASPTRFHRELRDKRMTKSVLDDVAGLGEARRKRLVQGAGRRGRRAEGDASTSCGRCRGCPTRSPTRCTCRLHG